MGELHPRHVEGDRALACGDRQHLGGRYIMDLRILIDEAADEPRAGQPIDLGTLTGDPFHGFSFLVLGGQNSESRATGRAALRIEGS